MTTKVSRRVAYCHPESVAIDPNWLKNLVLFFDEICVLLPDMYREEFFARLDWLATPLIDSGTLHLLRPEDLVNEAVSDSMARIGTALIDIGAFRSQPGKPNFELSPPPVGTEHELYTRLPSVDLDALMEYTRLSPREELLSHVRIERSTFQRDKPGSLIRRLTEAHLLRPTGRDGESFADPVVRASLLALLPLVIRNHATSPLLKEIIPVTDRGDIFGALSKVIDLPPFRRVGEVVQVDIGAIGINTESVPVIDLVAFRAEHQEVYSRYLNTAEDIARKLAESLPDERLLILQQREQQVEDELHELRKITRQWGRPLAGISIALSGATWSAIHGDDFIGGALAGLGGLIGFRGPDRRKAKLNYLFQLQSSYGSPMGLRESITNKKSRATESKQRRTKKRRRKK
jgi:hypothetical protein